MDAIEAIRSRRSVRSYTPRPVARALIEAIIRDAAAAPYIFVSLPEPWLFTVIEGRERIAAFGARAKDYARAHRPQVKHYEWADRPDFSVFHGAPAVIVISGRAGSPVAASECDRAGQNLAISAHARGLGACWVGSPILWLRDRATRTELGIPEAFEPHAAFALGHPAEATPAPEPPRFQIAWIAGDTAGDGGPVGSSTSRSPSSA